MMDTVSIGMSKITPYKGGRSERIEARITPEAKTALLARVDRKGSALLLIGLKPKQYRN